MNDGNHQHSIAQRVGDTAATSRRPLFAQIRGRVIAGLLLVLPFIVTARIVAWLYAFVDDYIIRPIAGLVVNMVADRTEGGIPPWFETFGAPMIGLTGVLALLYLLGFFARSRIERVLDAFLLRVPIVTSIHKAVRQLFAAVSGTSELTRFQRVVLVEFPHPGMRVPGFVTASCRDEATGKPILCIYVPTTPVPTSGYVLLVPEENVTELNWALDQTVQAVVSFGITAPPTIRYHAIASAPATEPASEPVSTPKLATDQGGSSGGDG